MEYQVACECGRRTVVTSGMAGTDMICPCGRTVAIPALYHLRQQAGLPGYPEVAPDEERARDEFRLKLIELTPRVYVTRTLIAINVLVFILMTATGISATDPSIPDLLKWGASFGPETADGGWWRLLTATFVHMGILHLAMNMLVLGAAGPLVERMVGNVGFLLLYVVSGIVGSLVSLLWHCTLVGAGASGAIFGVYGAFLSMVFRDRESIPTMNLGRLRNSGIAFLGVNLILGLFVSNIDSAAHVGGFIGGILCGIVLGQQLSPAAIPGRSKRNRFVAGMGLILILGGILFARPWLGDVVRAQHELEQFDAMESKAIDLFNRALAQWQREELTDAAFADILERDILPDWKDSRRKLKSLSPPSEILRLHLGLVVEYANLRQTSWELLATALRTGDHVLVQEAWQKQEGADTFAKRMVEYLEKR